jgi:ABC-type uncharacterized transport system permease subunit
MADFPLRLERRPAPSDAMRYAAPLLASLAMFATGLAVFAAMGVPPLAALTSFFVTPLESLYGVGELLLKATPLALCALGLAIGFRANVWNIGAEGQLTLGAITAGGVALFVAPEGPAGLALALLAGIAGGMAWAAIPALLRTRFNTSEILVSLMLVYVAQLLQLPAVSRLRGRIAAAAAGRRPAREPRGILRARARGRLLGVPGAAVRRLPHARVGPRAGRGALRGLR